MVEILPNWHPILVHFTVALLTLACLLHIAVLLVNGTQLKTELALVAQWNLWIGALITIVTVGAGWYAYNTVNHDNPSHLMMIQHRNIAMVTFAIFLALSSWSFIRYRKGVAISGLLTFLLILATGSLATTAWYGGEIVYRHGLGVMSLPSADKHHHADGHDHDHSGDEHAHSGDDDGHDHDHSSIEHDHGGEDMAASHESIEHTHESLDSAAPIDENMPHDHNDHSEHPH